jgi:ferritin-like metal-binding protein YciE
MNHPLNKPSDLFFDQLLDIHSVETQIAGTLPDLSRMATLPDLREIFVEQLILTKEQNRRVSTIIRKHGKVPGGDLSKGMKGLIEGGNEHLVLATDDTVRDLMLIAHYSRMKYYEIAAYHFATTLAENLELYDEAETLSTIREEERDSAHAIHTAAATLFCRV